MNCINCGAPAEAANPVFQCPYCGGFNQAVPVVLAQALRIETLNETATAIVPRWSALPASFIQSFSTGMDNQQAVSVHLLQGDGEKLEQNRKVGLFIFDEIPPAPRGVPSIQFIFEIAENGMLQVSAENLSTGKLVTFPRMQLDVLKKAG